MSRHRVDPEFDLVQRAYYYVRVLDIPTLSRLDYDQAFCGQIDLQYDAVMVQQNRAYTSPIWYALEAYRLTEFEENRERTANFMGLMKGRHDK